MAVSSPLFVASPEEAQLNDGFETGDPERRAQFYRVHDTSLKPIFESIEGSKCERFEPAAMSEDFEQITFTFPQGFVEVLSGVTDSDRTKLIEDWKDSGEAPYDNDSDLAELLEALIRLSKLALSRNEKLYLWNSL